MIRSFSLSRWLNMRLHKPSLPFCLLSTLLLGGLMAYQGVEGFQYDSNETTNLWLRISHASSAILFVILALIWLPVLNNLLRRLRICRFARYQLMDQKRLHRLLGYGMLVMMLAHGVSQLVYFNTLKIPFQDALMGRESDLVRSMRSTMYEFVTEDESIDMIALWITNGRSEKEFHTLVRPILKDDCTKCHSTSSTQTYAIPSLPLSTYQDAVDLSYSGIQSRQFRINISGLILLCFFLAMAIFALPPLRKRLHHYFQHLHRLGYWMLPLLALHIPQWYWLLPALLLLVWDMWLEKKHTYPVQAATLAWLDSNTLTLTLKLPDLGKIRAGDYVQVNVPAVSLNEWHPFSIASYQDDNLVLKINIAGDWTTQLASYCNVCPLYVEIRGPYPSPASQSHHSQNKILIAGGIGITPYWQWLETGLNEHTTLIWVIKDSQRLEWLRPLISRLSYNRVHIFVTDEAAQLPEWVKFQDKLLIKKGRPCWDSLSKQFSSKKQGDCYLCGPQGLMTAAGRSFRARNWHVFKESF